MPYTNDHGHEPVLDEDPNAPDPLTPEQQRRHYNLYVRQAGHLPIDVSRCQAPKINLGPLHKERCPDAPVCVMVENQPNSSGRIAGMSLCAFCRDRIIRTQGELYAKFTPLTV